MPPSWGPNSDVTPSITTEDGNRTARVRAARESFGFGKLVSPGRRPSRLDMKRSQCSLTTFPVGPIVASPQRTQGRTPEGRMKTAIVGTAKGIFVVDTASGAASVAFQRPSVRH